MASLGNFENILRNFCHFEIFDGFLPVLKHGGNYLRSALVLRFLHSHPNAKKFMCLDR